MKKTIEVTKENEHRVIRLTDWHYTEKTVGRGRGGVAHSRDGVAENIVCVGTDRIDLITNPTFLKRVYQSIYGKEKWHNNYVNNILTISKITFRKVLSLSLAPEHI